MGRDGCEFDRRDLDLKNNVMPGLKLYATISPYFGVCPVNIYIYLHH